MTISDHPLHVALVTSPATVRIANGPGVCVPVFEHARLACLDEAPVADEEGFDVSISAGWGPRAVDPAAYRKASGAEADYWFKVWGLFVALSGRHCVLC